MILEMLERDVLQFINYVLNLLPVAEITYPTDLVDSILNIITGTGYFLPLSDLALMISIQIFIIMFTISWKAIQRIWDALPFI